MRKIQEFILKDKEIFVGLEDSKRSWKICARSGGTIVNQTSMPADYTNLRNYFTNKFPDCSITVIYEAGFSGFGLHDDLVADGVSCVVTPPHTVTQEKCNKQKNDHIDSRRLAKNLENNDYRSCHIPDKQLREDRQIVRLYGQLQRDIVRVCNRIRRMLEFHGLDDPATAGRWSQNKYRQLASNLETMQLSASLLFSFQTTFNELFHLWHLRKSVLKELSDLAKSERYKRTVELLKSAPGIGLLTAIRLTLEWGDLSRFKRKENFSSFLGPIPSDYSTGESDHKGRITKQGHRGVRSWLVESAWITIRKDPVMLAKYQTVKQNSGSSKKAIVAVARKLAIRLRALVLTGQMYELGVLE